MNCRRIRLIATSLHRRHHQQQNSHHNLYLTSALSPARHRLQTIMSDTHSASSSPLPPSSPLSSSVRQHSSCDKTTKKNEDEDAVTLAQRMKSYEDRTNIKMDLTARPFIVRLDGNSFSTFTKPFVKPFDPELHRVIVLTAGDVMDKFNALTAYVCSDEISLIFPFESSVPQEGSSPTTLFGGRIQKIVSLVSGYTSMRFNHHLLHSTMFAQEGWQDKFRQQHRASHRYQAMLRERGEAAAEKMMETQVQGAEKSVFGGVGIFDSRIFPLPSVEEVAMNIIWRSKSDCVRNSKSLLGTMFFKQKKLNGLPADKVVQMLQEQHGVDWNEMPSTYKYGTFIKKEEYVKDGYNPITKETVKTTRRRLRAKSFLIARNKSPLTAEFLYADTWNQLPEDHPFWRTTVGMLDLGEISS